MFFQKWENGFATVMMASIFLLYGLCSSLADTSFKIVRSFPVSEPSWGAKVGEYYLVAAQRAILVYRQNRSNPQDYELVNTLFSGLDGRLENGVIDGSMLYLGASKQGILVYRLSDLASPDATPVLRYASNKPIGSIAIQGERLYALYQSGGLAVLNKSDLTLMGEGLFDNTLFGLNAIAPGIVYTSAISDYTEMLVIDAENPMQITVARKIKGLGHAYPTMYYWPGVVEGQTFYIAESNGGVGVYDLADPLNPTLRYRYGATGKAIGGRSSAGAIKKFALLGNIGYLIRDGGVHAVSVSNTGMTPLKTFAPAASLQCGPREYSSLWIHEGALAIPTNIEGIRFYDLAKPEEPVLQVDIDLPSRIEGLAKLGRMLYATADQDGVWQLDWDTHSRPAMRKRIPLKGLSEDLTLYKNHLYVANGLGLGVIDVSDENNPHEVFYWDYPYSAGPNINEGWVEGVDEANDILFAALGPGGVAAFDLSNPAKPVLLKIIKPGSWGNDIAVEPNRRLLCYTGMEKFALVNVADPRNPVVLSNIAVPEGKNTQGSAFSPDGNYLAVCQGVMFSIFDIQNPAKPVLLKSYVSPSHEEPFFYRDYLLVGGRGGGVSLWKIGNTPADLSRIQTLPCYYYNSKFWVESNRIFTNSEGVDEFMLVEDISSSIENFSRY